MVRDTKTSSLLQSLLLGFGLMKFIVSTLLVLVHVMFPFIVSTLTGRLFCFNLSIGLERKEKFIIYPTYLNDMVSVD